MKIYEKLLAIQSELKAPKSQYNSFGKYKYRSCEDILEALKPLLAKHKACLTLQDEVVLIGERFYIKATATLTEVESGEHITNNAVAREEDSKKGMDGSQITGTASSYARKYCLNGLFNIDDTKDADTEEYQQQTKGKAAPKTEAKPLIKKINGITSVLGNKGYVPIEGMNLDQLRFIQGDNRFKAIHDEVTQLLNKGVKK